MKDTPEKQPPVCGKRAALKGCAAVLGGVFIAGALVLGLSTYADRLDPDTFTAAQSVPFPDSQAKLQAMAAKLQPPQKSPQEIEPAAGKR